jgi:hypothetical protein
MYSSFSMVKEPDLSVVPVIFLYLSRIFRALPTPLLFSLGFDILYVHWIPCREVSICHHEVFPHSSDKTIVIYLKLSFLCTMPELIQNHKKERIRKKDISVSLDVDYKKNRQPKVLIEFFCINLIIKEQTTHRK